jgi:protein-disulfide isomerase
MAMNPNQAAGRPSRNTLLIVVGAAVAIAAVFIVAAVLLRDDASSSASPTPIVDLEGIPQDGAFLGSPDAKVTLIEYADLQCPACRSYAETFLPVIVDEYVRPGKVLAEFRGYPFLGNGDPEDDSLRGQRFLLAAGKQNKLWQLMEALYRHQGAEHSGWLTDDLVRELASEIDGLDVDQLFADAETEEIAQAAQQALVDAQEAGITGTPTILVKVGDEQPYMISVATPDQMREALDAALQG